MIKIIARWDNEGCWTEGQVFEVQQDADGWAYIQCGCGKHKLTDARDWHELRMNQINRDDQFYVLPTEDEIQQSLERLAAKGLVQKRTVNGKAEYGLTELGEQEKLRLEAKGKPK